MNSKELARYLVLGSALAGLTAGTQILAAAPLGDAKAPTKTSVKKAEATVDKHGCKGMNSCKGHGNCKSGDNGCSGKNSCKGKGGCASKEMRHDCAGKNACKGQGPGGKNDCKGKGSCSVPPKATS